MKKLLLLTSYMLILFTVTSYSQWNDGGTWIRSDDNVGIGSHTNAHSLYVRKNKTGWQTAFINRGGAGTNVYIGHGAGYGMHIRGMTTGGQYTLDLYNKTQRTNIFYNNGNVGLGLVGSVGVGTASPSTKLDVRGRLKCTTSLSVGAYSSNHRGLVVDNGSSNGWSLLDLKNANGTHMKVYGNGRVVLGHVSSTPAGYNLYMKNGILAEKVRVAVQNTSDWADYVFEDEYPLLSLEELTDYIAKGKSLTWSSFS